MLRIQKMFIFVARKQTTNQNMKRILISLLMVLPLSAFGEVVWFDGQHPITYQMPKQVEPVVKIALEMWKDDMRQVTGLSPYCSILGLYFSLITFA